MSVNGNQIQLSLSLSLMLLPCSSLEHKRETDTIPSLCLSTELLFGLPLVLDVCVNTRGKTGLLACVSFRVTCTHSPQNIFFPPFSWPQNKNKRSKPFLVLFERKRKEEKKRLPKGGGTTIYQCRWYSHLHQKLARSSLIGCWLISLPCGGSPINCKAKA